LKAIFSAIDAERLFLEIDAERLFRRSGLHWQQSFHPLLAS
jgi:hypothetical protein